MHANNNHQQKQIEVINQIEAQVKNQSLQFSTITPVADYRNDPRLCLTSVHLPSEKWLENVVEMLIKPLREIEPNFYYYQTNELHMTIKNIRRSNDPANFRDSDMEKAKTIFSQIVPKHHQFKVYFYRLLLFPNNLALIGTTDEELDNLFIELDKELINAGLQDDGVYFNKKYYFSNMTLARFNQMPSEDFKHKVKELSDVINFDPYIIDSVTLLTCNAVLQNKHIIGSWKL